MATWRRDRGSGDRVTANRVAAGILSLALLALLVWTTIARVGDLHTRIVLAVGIVLGSLYTVLGRVPTWIVHHSGGSITDDDDPSNLSPRVYLPILFGVFLLAAAAFVVVVFVL